VSIPVAGGEIWADQLTLAPEEPINWIWHGLVAPANLTLLTSQWKAGKTTLLSILLGLRVTGGELGGLPVRPGKSLVISEEPPPLWVDRIRKHKFANNVCFILRPFRTLPGEEEWLGLIDRVLAIKRQHGVDLMVIDPLAPLLRNENLARSMLETLLPLGQLLHAGMAVLLLHHPGRGERLLGQAARGSGALLGHVDISIEMRFPAGNPQTRRRRLYTLSRHAVSPQHLTLELDETGTTYRLAPETAEEQFEANWGPISLILADAPQKLTRQDIILEWPPDLDQPGGTTIWRSLDRAVEQGLVLCEGKGSKGDPFRYWLPQREAVWQQDPLYALMEHQRQDLKVPFESLTERKEKLRQAGETGSSPNDRG
jgi:hypothetical protein